MHRKKGKKKKLGKVFFFPVFGRPRQRPERRCVADYKKKKKNVNGPKTICAKKNTKERVYGGAKTSVKIVRGEKKRGTRLVHRGSMLGF